MPDRIWGKNPDLSLSEGLSTSIDERDFRLNGSDRQELRMGTISG